MYGSRTIRIGDTAGDAGALADAGSGGIASTLLTFAQPILGFIQGALAPARWTSAEKDLARMFVEEAGKTTQVEYTGDLPIAQMYYTLKLGRVIKDINDAHAAGYNFIPTLGSSVFTLVSYLQNPGQYQKIAYNPNWRQVFTGNGLPVPVFGSLQYPVNFQQIADRVMQAQASGLQPTQFNNLFGNGTTGATGATGGNNKKILLIGAAVVIAAMVLKK